MTDCCPAGSGLRAGKKSQKQPWSCARRHCSVNVPPSGPWSLSRLSGGRAGSKEMRGPRDRDTDREVETRRDSEI